MRKPDLLAYPSLEQRPAYRKRNRAYATQEQKTRTYILLKAATFPLHAAKEETATDPTDPVLVDVDQNRKTCFHYLGECLNMELTKTSSWTKSTFTTTPKCTESSSTRFISL